MLPGVPSGTSRATTLKSWRLINEFVGPTKKTMGFKKPPVTTHYGNTFNAVDRFNSLVSMISFSKRITDLNLRVLIGLIEVALVQPWVLLYDWRQDEVVKDEYTSLKKFIEEIYDTLLQ